MRVIGVRSFVSGIWCFVYQGFAQQNAVSPWSRVRRKCLVRLHKFRRIECGPLGRDRALPAVSPLDGPYRHVSVCAP
jgi:hypothetical protein